MRDDEFQRALDTWAESEKESAPDLRPTEEMVRLVQAKGEPPHFVTLGCSWRSRCRLGSSRCPLCAPPQVRRHPGLAAHP
jgi:hypothetical protein